MEPNPIDVASQLRKPTGEFGVEIGDFMHKGNADSYKYLLEVIFWQKGVRVMEVGMGAGMHIKALVQSISCKSYLGLDYSETMIEEAKKHTAGINDISFVCGNAEEMDVLDGSCDILFTINTVYFYENPLGVFKEMYRVLGKDGKVVIGKRTKEDLDLLSNITDHGFNKLSGEQVENYMREAGFSDVSTVVYADSEKEFPTGELIKLHTEFVVGTK